MMRFNKLTSTFLILLLFTFTNFIVGKEITENIPKDELLTVPGQFIVKFKAPGGNGNQVAFSKISSVAARYNITSSKQVFSRAKNAKLKKQLNLRNIYLFETNKGSNIKQIVNELSRDPAVEYAEPVYLSKLEAIPNDPLYGDQHALPQISAPDAWDIQFSATDVIIGVIDSGVDWDHEDLADNIWSNSDEIPNNGIDDDSNGYVDDVRGWDFVRGVSGDGGQNAHPNEDGETEDNDPMDFDGHGTHVSGIAGAVTNNNIGVASAAAGATIMPLRCGYHANDGIGYVPSIFAAEAYIYAADNGAHITNQSSGNSGQAILDAAYYAFSNGVLILESAGNGDAITPSALGHQDWVISVGAVNQNDQKTYYSSYGEYVEVSAPGGELFVGNDTWGHLSTIVEPSNLYGGAKYTKFQGTSMAAPLVASAAALIKSNNPTLDVIELFSTIVETADNIDAQNPDYIDLLGSGRINLHRALTETVTPEPQFNVVSTDINDASGNGDGILNAGEQVELKLTLRNNWADASNVSAQLSSTETWPVSVVSDFVNVGNVSGIINASEAQVEIPFTVSAGADAIPIPQQFQLTINADGYSQTIDYQIAVSPHVLFVADFQEGDNKYFDYSSIYFEAFRNSRISYDFVHHLDVEITSELLNKYSIVVWACEWHFPSLDSLDRVVLSDYLDNGGALFLSGQDIGWDLAENEDNLNLDFLNNYLKVNFLADDVGVSQIFGVEDEPITEDMEIDFFQPRRDGDQQFPDAFEPIDGAVSILNYSDGRSGAIKYAGNYNLVYFGFGGFEAVSDQVIRNTLMKNVIDWLSGIEYGLDELKDTEEISADYTVNLAATSFNSTISNAQLYWDIDGELPFNNIEMSDDGEGFFRADIPAQNTAAVIEYFAYIETANGRYILTPQYSFRVGPDSVPPEIQLLSKPITNSINIFGTPQRAFLLTMGDNIGVDESSATVHYTVNDVTPFQSVALNYAPDEEIFTGSFSFNSALQVGDKVNYYFSVKDNSSAANETTSEVYEYFIDTLQVIDDYERGLSDWIFEGDWGLSSQRKSGEFSLTDSPEGFYESNQDISATYRLPFDLTPYQHAVINFYLRANLERNKDSLMVEVSTDAGNVWETVWGIAASSVTFKLRTADLTTHTGAGNDNVLIRFRMLTDDSGERDGVWIDDVDIVVSYNVVSVEDINALPVTYELAQNFPNPFNPSTVIRYSLPEKSSIKLHIYNSLGELVTTLVDEVKPAGRYEVKWNAQVASGIYFYKIEAGNFRNVKKMILLK